MRRLPLLIVVLLLAMPAGAGALRRGPGDGTLVVQGGRGTVFVNARGGILGRFDTGRIVIEASSRGEGSEPIVYGAERIRELGRNKTQYIGEDVRFRLIGGSYRVRITAVYMDLSVVGRGFVLLDGSGFTDPGRYSVNGGPFQPLPSVPTKVPLGASAPGTLGGK